MRGAPRASTQGRFAIARLLGIVLLVACLGLAVKRSIAILECAADFAELPLDRDLGRRRSDGFAPARGSRRAGGPVSDTRG